MFEKILSDSMSKWKRESELMNYVYELVDKGDMPCFIYKGIGGFHYRPLIDVNSKYWKRPYGKVMLIGSQGYSFDRGDVRRINNENLRQVRDLDKQIMALEKKKQELLDKVWKKNKKLTWQFAKDWDDKRKVLFKKFGLEE